MPKSELTADQSEDPTFIHSRVDDLGLSMAEFRIYCHLKRRANHGVSWPGIDSIAKVCRAHRETIMTAIQGLEERKMLTVTRTKGEANRYRLTKPSTWKNWSEMVNDRSDDQSEMVNATSRKEGTLPVGNGERKGIHSKVNPIEGRANRSVDILEELRAQYPGVNVDAEVPKMKRWLERNKGRQMTKRFMENWLDKADVVVELNGHARKPTLSYQEQIDQEAREEYEFDQKLQRERDK